MKEYLPTKYYLTNTNEHLLDIVNKEYSIELGCLDIDIFKRLLKHEKLTLDTLTSLLITPNGLGNLTGKTDELINLQFNYLYNQLMNSSSNILAVTYGMISYYVDKSIEKAAPLFVFPIQYSEKRKTIQFLEKPLINSVLLKTLKELGIITNYGIRKLERKLQNELSINDVDEVLLTFKNRGVNVGTTSFLTTFKIDYQEEYFNPDDFNKVKGIGESYIFKFLYQYYNNVHQITPLNIEQKYVLNKVHNGENLCIDGRLGTGKTETAINIIADAVYDNKKVLYVNQSKKSLNELKERITKLGLGDYLFDSTLNLNDYSNEPKVKYQKNKDNINIKFNDVEVFSNTYLGYRCSDILTQYTLLKNKNLVSPIDIEPSNLERSENENIVKILNEIEPKLKNITPIYQNIWQNIRTIRHITSSKEIASLTNTFYQYSNTFFDQIRNISINNHLKEVQTIKQLNHLIQVSDSFKEVMPLNTWFEEDFFDEAYEAIKQIDEIIDKFEILNDYFNSKIVFGYNHGEMKVKYDSLKIFDLHLVERILSDEVKVEDLQKQIVNLSREIKKCIIIFEKYFSTDEDLDKNYEFYLSIYQYLMNTRINDIWAKDFTSNPKNYLNSNKEFINLYDEYNNIKNEYIQLTNDKDVTFDIIERTSKELLENKIINIFKNKYNLKDDEKLNKIYSIWKQLYQSGNQLMKQYPYLIEPKYSIESEWNNYYSFLKFIESFKDNNDYELFCGFLKNYDILDNPSNSELYYYLRLFNFDYRLLDGLVDKLEYFQMKIDRSSVINTLTSIKDCYQTVEAYAHFKNYCWSCFINKNITVDDIFTLINKDEELETEKRTLEDKKDRYTSLFGNLYKNEFTDTSILLKALSIFRLYKSMLSKDFDYSSVSINELVKDLISDVIKIRSSFYMWQRYFRQFFTCFNNADFSFQNYTFNEMVETLSKYQEDIDELDDTYYVLERISKLREEGLIKFVNKIVNDKLKHNLADTYMYSVMDKYLKNIKNKNIDLTDNSLHEEFINNQKYELKVCNNNLYELTRRYHKSKASLYNHIRSYNTDNIQVRRIYNCPKTKKVQLIDTFGLINAEEAIHYFDLIIIDDAHLSTITKYGSLDTLLKQQLVVFGEKEYHNSVYNGLLNHISKERLMHFNKTYIEENYKVVMNSNLNKAITFDTDIRFYTLPINNLNDYCEMISKEYCQTKKKIIVRLNDNTSCVYVYRYIANYLSKLMNITLEELKLLNERVIIMNSFEDMDVSGDVTYIYFNDYNKNNIYYHYQKIRNSHSKDIKLCYERNSDFEITKLYRLISNGAYKKEYPQKNEHPLYLRLKQLGYKIIPGKGIINLIINSPKKPIGIIIIDEKIFTTYYYNDEYHYCEETFSKFNFELMTFSLYDICYNLDEVVEKIKNKYGE